MAVVALLLLNTCWRCLVLPTESVSSSGMRMITWPLRIAFAARTHQPCDDVVADEGAEGAEADAPDVDAEEAGDVCSALGKAEVVATAAAAAVEGVNATRWSISAPLSARIASSRDMSSASRPSSFTACSRVFALVLLEEKKRDG